MLVLKRTVGQSFVIGPDIEVFLVSVLSPSSVRIGIEAPSNIQIVRREIVEEYNAPAPPERKFRFRRCTYESGVPAPSNSRRRIK
jgi:carbon storage regulator CsrA